MVLVPRGGGDSSSRRMGNAVDIVKFQVFFKQSIYCVTLNPGVTLRPLSLRQGVTDHFTIAASSGWSACAGMFYRWLNSRINVFCFSLKMFNVEAAAKIENQ